MKSILGVLVIGFIVAAILLILVYQQKRKIRREMEDSILVLMETQVQTYQQQKDIKEDLGIIKHNMRVIAKVLQLVEDGKGDLKIPSGGGGAV